MTTPRLLLVALAVPLLATGCHVSGKARVRAPVPRVRVQAGANVGHDVQVGPGIGFATVAGGNGMTCSQGGCRFVCPPGGQCSATCSGGFCDYTCGEGAQCSFTCSGGGCTHRAEPGAQLASACSGGGCNQACLGGASCTRTCSGGGCR